MSGYEAIAYPETMAEMSMVPAIPAIRATHSLVREKDERDTYVRCSSIMLKCRIAYTGALRELSHLYGNGVSIVPNVCLSLIGSRAL